MDFTIGAFHGQEMIILWNELSLNRGFLWELLSTRLIFMFVRFILMFVQLLLYFCWDSRGCSFFSKCLLNLFGSLHLYLNNKLLTAKVMNDEDIRLLIDFFGYYCLRLIFFCYYCLRLIFLVIIA